MWSPAHGKEESVAIIEPEDCTVGKQLCGKGPGILVGSKQDMMQQCALVAKKPQSILGCTYNRIDSKFVEVIMTLSSALVSLE